MPNFHPAVNDHLENKYSLKIAKVIEVNNQFGWFKVRYLDGYERIYDMCVGGTHSFIKLTDEERADYFLKLANAGLLDDWDK